MATAATIVVQVQDPSATAEDQQLTLFLDDHLNPGPDGKPLTQFPVGSRVYLLLQILAWGLTIDDVRSSDGTLTRIGEVTRQQTDQVIIDSDTKTVSLSKIPSGGLSASWYGNSGIVSVNGRQITLTGDLPMVVDLTYNYKATSYRLVGPNVALDEEETWPVRVTAYTPESTEDADNCPA